MSMKKILFTGFVPFLDNLVNPSKEILELIDDQDTYLLDVDYKKADEFFLSFDPSKYDFVVSFGLASSRTWVSLERVAHNLVNTKVKDNSSYIPSSPYIELGGKDLETNLNLEKYIERFEDAKMSFDAGTYLCNYVYYNFLKKMKGNALFIHLPSKEVNYIKIIDTIKKIIDEI